MKKVQPSTKMALGILLVGALLAATLLGGWSLGRDQNEPLPQENSVDAGFSRDMQVHHLQAAEMAVIIRDQSEDPDIRGLGLDILLTQQQQAGQMYGWLSSWGLSQTSSTPAMTWMDMGGMRMMGLASDADITRLKTLEGTEAEKLFLELMIVHHQGGIHMAEVAVKDATEPQVERLAQSIVTGQASEITRMENLLAERS